MISGATLSTPPLEFDTVASGFDVHVTATFTQVTPGAATGLVTATPPAAPSGQGQKGSVALRTSIEVALNLVIGDPDEPFLVADCAPAGPVSLELLSDGPYTEATGGRIVDADFMVPPVEVDNAANCIELVASGVNGLLAGSGHSLSLVIEGGIPVPPIKPATRTTLSVDPSGGSLRGTEVSLIAAVVPVEANPLDPTGTVVFRDGTRILGSAELQPDGTAILTTSDIRAGDRSLTAAYQGDVEFGPSTSEPVAYAVAPAPVVTGTFPEYITRGAPPVEFDVTIDNAGSSRAIANGRLDLSFQGLAGPANLVLEQRLPDSSWVPVPLDGFVSGTLGPDGGTLVPAGAVQTRRLRISVVSTAPILPYQSLTLRLVVVDPDAGDDGQTVATTHWPFQVATAARTATTTAVTVYEEGGLRPGQTLTIEAVVSTTDESVDLGHAEFLLDGKVMPTAPDTPPNGSLQPEQIRRPVGQTGSGYVYGLMSLPADLSTGPHVVSVRYLGSASYLPSTSVPQVVQVLEPLSSTVYDCDYSSVTAQRFGAYVEAFVRLPAYAEDGEELVLDDVEVTVTAGGLMPGFLYSNLTSGGGFGVQRIEIDLGGGRTIEGDGVDFTPSFDPWDQVVTLQNLEGTIVVDGQPGEVMALPIERIATSGQDPVFNFDFTWNCVPQGAPAVLAEVGVAGVSLSVESSTGPVRAGHSVVLAATAAPAGPYGVIEFFSGSQSLGTASGASGVASIAVDDLPVGSNVLSARYYGVPWSPFTSNVVELVVRPATECAEFAAAGTGATVRLVYLELLGRCPDQAGFDYWKGRLDGGVSPEVFARSISSSPEAVGMVVDDAYVTMLARKADAAGKAFWVERMRTGTGRYDQLLADLGASAEFWSKAGSSNVGFVTRVYGRLLNRAPDQAGLDFWVGRLVAGSSPRALIVSLANLDEPLGRLVASSYDEILGRAPSGTERTAGIGVLRSTGDRSGFYARLIGQAEFATRAQGFPNPED